MEIGSFELNNNFYIEIYGGNSAFYQKLTTPFDFYSIWSKMEIGGFGKEPLNCL